MTDSFAFIKIMLAQSALQQSGYYHGPVDGKTWSSFFFPAGMSLEEAEKKITENRKLHSLSETSH